jgi:hypothetical protein
VHTLLAQDCVQAPPDIPATVARNGRDAHYWRGHSIQRPGKPGFHYTEEAISRKISGGCRGICR